MSVKILEVNQDNNGRRLDNYLISIFKNIPKSKIYTILLEKEKSELILDELNLIKKLKPVIKIRIPPYLDNIYKMLQL
jgi:hypothetical protein